MRAVVNGKLVDLRELEPGASSPLLRAKLRSLDADVDRLAVKPETRSRLADSIEIALAPAAVWCASCSTPKSCS